MRGGRGRHPAEDGKHAFRSFRNATTQLQHELTPGVAFAGTRAAGGTAADLDRVCVFSDSDCVNVIHRGSIVGSPAYVPRTNGQLKLPIRTQDVLTARTSFAKDLAKGDTGPRQFMFDSAQVTATETDPEPAKQAATPSPTSSPFVSGGVWYYRVRGVNFSLPGTARAMTWSAPIAIRVAKPTFTVVKKSGR